MLVSWMCGRSRLDCGCLVSLCSYLLLLTQRKLTIMNRVGRQGESIIPYTRHNVATTLLPLWLARFRNNRGHRLELSFTFSEEKLSYLFIFNASSKGTTNLKSNVAPR